MKDMYLRYCTMGLPLAIGSKLVRADSVAIPRLWAGQSISEIFRYISRQDNNTFNLYSAMLPYQVEDEDEILTRSS